MPSHRSEARHGRFGAEHPESRPLRSRKSVPAAVVHAPCTTSVIPPHQRLVSRPFRIRSAPYFVASMSRPLSIRRAVRVASWTRETSSVSPPSSCHPMASLRPELRPFRSRSRCRVAQTTVTIVSIDRATPCAAPTADTAVMTQSPSSHPCPVSRLVAPPPHDRSSSCLVRTALSIAATRRAISCANQTMESRPMSMITPQYPESQSRRALLPPPPSMRSLCTANARQRSESSLLHP